MGPATHGENTPSFVKPVSSTTHASGPISCSARRTRTRRTGSTYHARGGHELLQLLVIRTEAFTHGLHGFPPPIKHQPAQIQVPCAALICS